MTLLEPFLRLIVAVALAIVLGKCVAKFKMPAILGWLLAGMMFGPHIFNILNQDLLDATWYHILTKSLECVMGLLFAKELVFKKLKKYGTQIFTITLFESLGTFFIVSATFAIICYFMQIPFYVAFVFGGIALATAPAPTLAIINELKTKGSVTSVLIPITMLDDVVAIAVFFSINSYIISLGAGTSDPFLLIFSLSVILPLLLGTVIGFLASFLYTKDSGHQKTLLSTLGLLIVTAAISFYVNNVLLSKPLLNFILVGIAVFTTIANRVSEEKMEQIAKSVGPLVGIALMVMIMNLGAPLDYSLIMGASFFTAVYILSRTFGKYFSTYLGATISHAEPTMKKYLGFTLLTHSGVSLFFTGIIVTSLNTFDTESALIVKGTIAAAAVINEIFAVIIAKKGFEWAGEIPKKQ